MKLIAYLLMALATMAGSISAATAYLVPLDAGLPDDRLIGITLAAPAGAYDPTTPEGEALTARVASLRAEAEARRPPEPEPLIPPREVTVETPPLPDVDTEPTGAQRVRSRHVVAPILDEGDTLSEGTVALLRERNVGYVKSQSFDPAVWFRTWPSWVFLASVAVLLGSSLTLRSISKSAGKKKAPAAGAELEGGPGATPSEPLAVADEINSAVQSTLEATRAAASESQRIAAIVERLGEVQRTLIPAFGAARTRIIAQHGMGGYARVMDAFAATERRINRAWSAAADGHEPEALASLEDAASMAPGIRAALESEG